MGSVLFLKPLLDKYYKSVLSPISFQARFPAIPSQPDGTKSPYSRLQLRQPQSDLHRRVRAQTAQLLRHRRAASPQKTIERSFGDKLQRIFFLRSQSSQTCFAKRRK